MSDDGQEFFETIDQVSTHDLNVIEIELHADGFLPDLANKVRRVFDMIQEIIRPVATVDRLNQQCNFLGGGQIGCTGQIVDKDAVCSRALLERHLAGQTMNPARANCAGIFERAGEQRLPVLLATRYGSKAKLAIALARWCIEPKDGELVPFDRRFYSRGRNLVGKLKFDRLEPCCCGGVDPLKQRSLGEEIPKIGSKTRHRLSLMIPCAQTRGRIH